MKQFLAALALGVGAVTLACPTDTRAAQPAPPATAPTIAAVTVADESALPANVKGKMRIYLLIGQSNMSGHGPLKDSTSKPHERVWMLGKDYKWKIATEPLDDPTNQVDLVSLDKNGRVGPGMAFALDMVKNDPSLLVGLVPCSKGGTPLHFFLKERGTGRDTLYGSALYRAKQAQKVGELAGILFFQGEGDATKRPEAFGAKWGENFTRFVHDFRTDLNAPNLPVVFAQVGTSDSKASIRWEEVKVSQAKVKIPHVTMIKTDDLKRLDAVHFTTPSQEEIGRRFALALRDLTKSSPSASAAPAGNPVKEIVYKKTPQGDLSLFVEYPPNWKATDRRAAIVFFFGGGWARGTPQQFAEQAAYLAGRGMVTIRPDYRTSSKHKTTPLESVEDARSAMRFVRAHASEWGVDASRIVGAGGSAGGHLAACCALGSEPNAPGDDLKISCRPNALVLFNPVMGMEVIGTNLPQRNTISPVLLLDKTAPPTVAFYGTDDKFYRESLGYQKKAKAVGVRYDLYTANGLPHGFFNGKPWKQITLKQADLFLTGLGYLQGEPTLMVPASSPGLKKE